MITEPTDPQISVLNTNYRSWGDLHRDGDAPVDFVVEGLVPRRGVTLLTGEGGVGKSFMLIELAYCVALGRPFLGRFACEQGPVLIADLENDEATIARRIHKITAGHIDEVHCPSELPVYFLRKDDAAAIYLYLNEPQGKAVLDHAVNRHLPVLLIIDPLTAAHSVDENDNIAMRRLIVQLQVLARSFNMAVLLVHHPRKRGLINDPGQMIRGASDLRNAVDSHLFIRRTVGNQVLIDHDKSRHAPPVNRFKIEIADDDSGAITYVRHAGETKAAASRLTDACAGILTLLCERGTCRSSELMNELTLDGINPTTARRALDKLVQDRAVVKQSWGMYCLAQEVNDH